jgi:four helix bundle protein
MINIKHQKGVEPSPGGDTRTTEFRNRLYTFTLRLIDVIDKLPNDVVARRMGDQLLRSGTSVMANYVEAKAAASRRDYINFFTIALKSANESILWISLLKDSGRLKLEDSEWIKAEMEEIANILAASIITLKSKK